ncbi:MAG: peptide-methionine (S)-S-oxide reductase MsrA [Gammaproteobacteria bacterium]|nr:peptide-methionine (S)-S-oxide reductase MsrA [Gammaproteobacteria bacterium]
MKKLKALFPLTLLLLLVTMPSKSQQITTQTSDQAALFAGGCFWCIEADFDKVTGVTKTVSGYIGGHVKNPSYKQVSAGNTGHTEAVQVHFDPNKVSYEQLLEIFWRNIDPTVKNKQFCDNGNQYRAEIFYQNPEQKKWAEQSQTRLNQTKPFNGAIVTEITAASVFYVAEDYHQDFHTKNPLRYKFYRYNCGRDKRLQQLWGKPGEKNG